MPGFNLDIKYVMREHSGKMDSESKERKIRKQSREACSITVDYIVDEETFHDYIKNISAGGVFIETGRKFEVGQEVVLSFTMPRYPSLLEIRGEVIRADSGGIAVKFKRNEKKHSSLMTG